MCIVLHRPPGKCRPNKSMSLAIVSIHSTRKVGVIRRKGSIYNGHSISILLSKMVNFECLDSNEVQTILFLTILCAE